MARGNFFDKNYHLAFFLITFLIVFSQAYSDLSITPVEDYLCSGAEGGPFSPSQKTYAVKNLSGASITWGVSESADWVECLPEWGSLNPGESVDVIVSITSAADFLTAGEYIKDVIFTDITNGVYETRQVILSVGTVSSGPVAWWKLDGDATDSSGNLHDGTVYSEPNWIVEGKVDGAIQLDGIDDFISVPAHDDLQPDFPFSISLWINADNPTSASFIVKSSPSNNDTYTGFSISHYSSGTIKVGYGNGGPPSSASQHGKISSTALQPGQWCHVTAVVRGYMDIDLYINGISEGDYNDGTATSIAYSNNDFFIGSLDGGYHFFAGEVDDVQIYDRALTEAEVAELAGIGPLVIMPADAFDTSGEPGGPFSPAYKDYTLKNIGGESIFWGIDTLPDWLDVDSSFGGLDPNETATVRVFLTEDADLFGEGLYNAAVTFNNLSITQDPVVRDVNLDIQIIRGIWATPESFDITLTEGSQQQDILTVGNDGTETLNFSLRTRTVAQSASTSAPNIATSAAPVTPQKIIFNTQQALSLEHKPDQVLVRFAPDSEGQLLVGEGRQQQLSSVLPGAEVVRQYQTVPGLSLVQLADGVTVEEALASLNAREDILYVQPNYRVYADSVFPNDARFDDLWGLHNIGQSGGLVDADIDAPEAWDISTGSDTVIVAVIDTGVDYNHEDLAANMWVNQAEYEGTGGVDDDGNGYVDDIYGYDFDHGDGDPMDDHYHGTHCAGTIGAVGNNGIGVVGVCWNVKIMAVKFLDSGGGGWTDDAIDSVEYATLMGAHIMSNSWGGGSYSQGLKDAIDAAGAAGIAFVAAAGNDSVNNDVSPHYPSSYTSDNVIAVMATDDNDNRSSFSSWGPTSVDIGAPGTSILSCEPGNQYQYLNGTSMATPHVAGACALLKSTNQALSVSEIRDILYNSVDSISALAGKCVSEGRLNINNAILETTVPWIEFDIEQGQLNAGQSMDITVTFDATELAPGAYHAEILILSDDPVHPTLTIPVELMVFPDPLEVTPEMSFDPNGLIGGPFEPNSMIYTMTNTGDTPLDWSIQSQVNWLTISQTAGTLESDEIVEILVSINENADVLDPNLYQETIIFNNLTLGSIHHREVNLKVLPPDMFTEQFDAGTFDLENKAITLRPDSSVSYYAACVEKESFGAFPLSVNAITLVSIGDDDYVEVPFDNSEQFTFYGVSYDRVYIGSNGYLTFGRGGSEFEPTLENHFEIPRIAPLFTDLTPTNGQSISYEQFSDKFVVTYNNVPIFGDKDATNSFQTELFFADGSIRIAYLDIAATNAVAGLSDGNGLPGIFEPSDLSSYIHCCDCGDTDGDGIVGLSDLSQFGLVWLENTCADPDWCNRADFDRSGQVDLLDWSMISENWKKASYAWSEPEFLLELNGKTWTEPQYLSELDDGQGNKAKAVGISADLLTIFFARYVPSLDVQLLFQAARNSIDEPFSQERRLSALSQTGGGMGGPGLSENGERLYYHEVHPVTGEGFLKVATWSETLQEWVYERSLEEIHYPDYAEYHPSLTADELTIYFDSTCPDGTGTSSIWTASRPSIEEPFTNLRQLTELDAFIEGAATPSVLPDGLTLYFHAMDSQDGNPAVYKVSRSSSSQQFTNIEKITFPGNDTMWELKCDVSPDGNTVYFQNGDAFEHGGIYMTTFEPHPTEIPAGQPHVTPDNLTIYFNRFVPEVGYKRIFKATRSTTNEPFSNEKQLSELIQTNGTLGSPCLSSDGQRLYYHEQHFDPDEGFIKVAVWSQESNQWIYEKTFDELHYGPGYGEGGASLTDDELTIFWHSNRPDGAGVTDIWTANRTSMEEPFTNIRNLTEINTPDWVTSPTISHDGLILYFNAVRHPEGDLETGSIYKASRSSVSEPFGNIQVVDIPDHETRWDSFSDVNIIDQRIYFYTTTEQGTGCYRTEWLPEQEDCLPR